MDGIIESCGWAGKTAKGDEAFEEARFHEASRGVTAGRTTAGRSSVGQDWKPVRGLRASGEVAAQILATFYDGLRPGDWLGTEAELAERFGVSRITVRDAVRTLEAQGILDVKVGARGGLRVAEGDPARFAEALAIQLHLTGIKRDELIEAQQAIEPVTAALAAERITDEQLGRLRDLVDRSRTLMASPQQFAQPALDFHLAVADGAGNQALSASLAAMRPLQGTEFREAPPSTSRSLARRIVTMHEAILEAIELHNPELAAERMREHLTHMAKGRRLPIAGRESHLLL